MQFPLHALVVSPAEPPKYPASHGPVHTADTWPVVFPKRPAGHSEQLPAPDKLYAPTGHTTAVSLVLPAGHAKPAVQLPLHAAAVTPSTLPNLPAGHGAVHAAVDSDGVDPYKPALQLVHTSVPD